MLIVHYQHRLPSTFDLDEEKNRYTETASYWDTSPALFFKAFLLREKGHHGAATNVYSSLYLWEQEAFRNFLSDGTFNYVTDRYDRPQISTALPVDARKGPSEKANFLYLERHDVPEDINIDQAIAKEAEHNRGVAASPDTVAAITGIDPKTWRFTRIAISERRPDGTLPGVSYQILHLARPLLNTLPHADGNLAAI
ncbi:MAG: DUF4865 family protein [Mycobacterium sp.]